MTDLAVQVTGLRKRFGSRRSVEVLDGVDLAVHRGEVLALLGPNGAGKTTTVRILATLLRPDGGTARVAGHDVVTDPFAVRERISLTGQHAAVDLKLTGAENLTLMGRLAHLPQRTARGRVTDLLTAFDLAEVASHRVATYSGGMRRRLDVAAGLLVRPEVMFLDEPTTGLDPRSRQALWAVIGEVVAGGTSVLLTTQYLEEADVLADRVALLDEGRVVAEGSPAALKARVGDAAVEAVFHSPAAADAARAVLAGRGLTATDAGAASARIPTDGSVRHVADVLGTLADCGASPVSWEVREPTLDDVFLALTGHRTHTDLPVGTDEGEAAA